LRLSFIENEGRECLRKTRRHSLQKQEAGRKMKKVITYGTYDLLHVGHINLLKRARELGDYLVVVLSSDEFNAIKHKSAYHSYEDRKIILESIKYVDEVIPEYNWEQKIQDVVDNKIDLFVMGDDWQGQFDFLKDYCEVVYLPRTDGISTTKIKQDLNLGVKKN
jgi:glycerol-3-phosphate cytidylyltransferase